MQWQLENICWNIFHKIYQTKITIIIFSLEYLRNIWNSLTGLYDITWFGAAYTKQFMKSLNCSKPCYTFITCSKIEPLPYNFIFTTKLIVSSILITIIGKWTCWWRHYQIAVFTYKLNYLPINLGKM